MVFGILSEDEKEGEFQFPLLKVLFPRIYALLFRRFQFFSNRQQSGSKKGTKITRIERTESGGYEIVEVHK